MRKLTFSGLLLALMIAIAGCSANGNSGTGSSPGTAEAPTNTAAADAENTPVEIRFVTHSNWEKPLTKVIAQFENDHPNIKVNVQYNPYAKLQETNEIMLAAGSEDLDVVTVDVPLTASYTVKGYLESLDAYFASEDRAKFVDTAIAAGTYNGELMSLPMNSSSVVLFYNKDLFTKYGVPFPSDNPQNRQTWEQVAETAKQLTKDGIYGFSFDQIGRAYQILPLLQSKGAAALDDTGTISAGYTNSPEAVSALQFYYDLFNTWKVSPVIKREESPDYFTSGKVAMFLSNTANLPKIIESGINFGIAPHPYFAGGEAYTSTGSLNLGISKFSKHKDEAAEFIEYVTEGDGAKILFSESGQLPALKTLLDKIDTDAAYSELPQSTLRLAAAESRTTAAPRPVTPGYLEWESNFNKAAEDIKNGADPQEALDSAVQIIDGQLRKYKTAGQ